MILITIRIRDIFQNHPTVVTIVVVFIACWMPWMQLKADLETTMVHLFFLLKCICVSTEIYHAQGGS